MIVKVINTSGNPLPKYETKSSAGMDARASFKNLNPRDIIQYGPQIVYNINIETSTIEYISLQPGTRVLIPTDLYIKIPEGYEVQVRPRSGLALKYGVEIVNSPGTIDAEIIIL